jgi:hypothetical protein
MSVPRGKPLFGGSLDRTHFECQQAKVRLVIRQTISNAISASRGRYQALASSLGQHHAASVSPGGDLVRRTFLVVSRNRNMRVIVAE